MPEPNHPVMYLSECTPVAQWHNFAHRRMHTPVAQRHTTVRTDICTLISQFLFFKKSGMHILTWPKRHMTSLKDAPDSHNPLSLSLLRSTKEGPPARSPLQPYSWAWVSRATLKLPSLSETVQTKRFSFSFHCFVTFLTSSSHVLPDSGTNHCLWLLTLAHHPAAIGAAGPFSSSYNTLKLSF